MSHECETVVVKGWDGLGSVVINKSDFDPKQHELYEPEKKAPAKKKTASK